MQTIKTIKWVLAHEPIELFLRAAKYFSSQIHQETKGQINIEVMTLSEYSNRYANGANVTKHDLLNLMDSGKIEMSQMYTTVLGRYFKDMFVLDMPFLFKSHEHAAAVLDGEIGKSLMHGLSNTTNIHGLAFTYSGGYRMIAGTKKIEKISDFVGMKIRIAKNPVAEDTLKSVGAVPVPLELEELNSAIKGGEVFGGESTYPRFYSMKQNEVAPFINDTQHSLFLTSILISKKFWATLTLEQQNLMSKIALSSAKLERQESVSDIKDIQQKCKQDGVSIVELNIEEKEKFRQATQGLYEKYKNFFSPGLLEKIIQKH